MWDSINTFMSIIYRITSKTSGKKYIGWTVKTAEQRWKVHCHNADRGHTTHLHHAIRLYGPNDFIIETIETGSDNDFMKNTREVFWIAQHNPEELYNMTSGGEGGVTSSSFKPGCVAMNKGIKMPAVSKAKKEYWKQWKKDNPGYKDKWKKYEPRGVSEADRKGRAERISNRNKQLVECPHCHKKGNVGNMKRWHFENCKAKS